MTTPPVSSVPSVPDPPPPNAIDVLISQRIGHPVCSPHATTYQSSYSDANIKKKLGKQDPSHPWVMLDMLRGGDNKLEHVLQFWRSGMVTSEQVHSLYQTVTGTGLDWNALSDQTKRVFYTIRERLRMNSPSQPFLNTREDLEQRLRQSLFQLPSEIRTLTTQILEQQRVSMLKVNLGTVKLLNALHRSGNSELIDWLNITRVFDELDRTEKMLGQRYHDMETVLNTLRCVHIVPVQFWSYLRERYGIPDVPSTNPADLNVDGKVIAHSDVRPFLEFCLGQLKDKQNPTPLTDAPVVKHVEASIERHPSQPDVVAVLREMMSRFWHRYVQYKAEREAENAIKRACEERVEALMKEFRERIRGVIQNEGRTGTPVEEKSGADLNVLARISSLSEDEIRVKRERLGDDIVDLSGDDEGGRVKRVRTL